MLRNLSGLLRPQTQTSASGLLPSLSYLEDSKKISLQKDNTVTQKFKNQSHIKECVLRLSASSAGGIGSPLARELRSHSSHGPATKKRKEEKMKSVLSGLFFFCFLDSKTLELKFRIPRLSFVAKFDVFLLHPVP